MNLKRDNVQCVCMLNIDSSIVKKASIFNHLFTSYLSVCMLLLTNESYSEETLTN